jgi:hypothetical protein
VQACHAALAAGRDLVRHPDPHLVLLSIPTQADLVALSVRLTKAGVAHRVFCEEDLGGRPTALATEGLETMAGSSCPQRELFRSLSLYKGAA